MEKSGKHNQNIKKEENEADNERKALNERVLPADRGFKTGHKSHGLTWEQPMDEQAFDLNHRDREED